MFFLIQFQIAYWNNILWHTEPNSRLVVKDGVLGVV